MRRVFLSFLGTSDYIPCIYYHGERPVENVRFVQEAIISLFCRDWTEEDRIFIFTTDQAREKNWLDNGHPKRVEKGLCQGLERRLTDLELNARIQSVPIEDMASQEEMWGMFQKMFELLEPDDTVIFDITHAFRSIPMLAIVVLNYAKVLKKIRLGGIYYGAFEVLGYPSEVEKMPMAKRLAPILDLTGFDTLLEWSAAIDGFLKSGNGKILMDLANQSIHPILRDHAEMRDAGNVLKRLSNNLAEFGNVLSTCRGQSVVKITQYIKQNFEQCGDDNLIPAFQPLLNHIRPRLEKFCGDDILDGMQAARWCMDHSLVQQGYTILQETLVTHLLRKANVDHMDKDSREIVTAAVHIARENKPPSEWWGAAGGNKPLTEKMMMILKEDDLIGLMTKLSGERNDLNHAGYNPNPQAPNKFFEKLKKHLEVMEIYLQGVS